MKHHAGPFQRSSQSQCLRAQGSIDLSVSGLDTTQRLSLTVGQIVHSLEANIEAGRSGVNSQHGDRVVNSIAGVVQLVAFPAVGATAASDGEGTADVREARQLAECGVFGIEDTSAGDCVGRRAGDIID